MLAIIDYNMGNVRSVSKAFEMIGSEVVVASRAKDLVKADKIVLPGVGAFADGMKHLKELGLIELLKYEILKQKKPFLGICLGMQLMAEESEEYGIHKGLGWLNAKVRIFKPVNKNLKIPHVGWNDITVKKESGLFQGIKEDSDFYFAHSYYMDCRDKEIVSATCNYGYDFTAAIEKENIFATQFHPEKSQIEGLKILENFVNWKK